MNALDRYIARTLLASVFLVMATLLMLGMLFVFIGEQSDVGTGHYGMLDALEYSAMSLPQFALESFPAASLIGGLIGIGILARSNEITVMRASGMSKLRLSRALLVAAAVLVGVSLLVSEFLAQPLSQLADAQKAFARYSNVSFAGAGGAWVKDGDVIMNVRSRTNRFEFGGMLIFRLNGAGRVDSVASAGRATAAGAKTWRLRDYAESKFDDDSVSSQQLTERTLETGAGADFLRLAVAKPAELALHSLYSAIHFLRANRLEYKQYEFAFWSRAARTVGIAVALLFTLPFGFGSQRAGSLSARVTLGVVLGIVYYLMQQLVENGTVVFNLNPLLLAWLPTSLLALAACVMLWRIR